MSQQSLHRRKDCSVGSGFSGPGFCCLKAGSWVAPAALVLGLWGAGTPMVYAQGLPAAADDFNENFEAIPQVRFTVTAFEVEGDNPLGTERAHAILKEFLGDHIGLEGLRAASDELEDALRKAGYTFHRVTLPPQRALGGVIKMKILAFKLGKIVVAGNTFHGEQNIIDSIPGLVTGQTPNTDLIGTQLEFANEAPSKKVKLLMKESQEEADQLDAHLQVQDADSTQIYTTLSNTGSSATGRLRLGVGYQVGNLFDKDHSLTLSYTTSPPDKIDKVTQLGVNYRVPLYGYETTLTGYATYSDVDSGNIGGLITTEVKGRGAFWGVRAEKTLPRYGSYRHKLALQFDDKFFDNSVTVLGVPIGVDVRSQPVSIHYSGNYEQPAYSLRFSTSYAKNTQAGSDNNLAAYNNNTTVFAAGFIPNSPNWEALRWSASGEWRFENQWQLKGRISGQNAPKPLIAGEKFGFGGASSVRGLEEREISGDEGYTWSMEVWTPLYVLKEPYAGQIQYLAYIDDGKVYSQQPTAGTAAKESASSAGLGFRYSTGKNLSISMDFAKLLSAGSGTNATSKYDNRAHVNIFYKF